MADLSTWQPWGIILACALVSYLPRAVGVLAGRRIDMDSPLFRWFSCVAYAMLAGLVSRMILLPLGPLREVAPWVRITATLVAVAVFLLGRRNLPLGIIAGLLSLMLLHGAFGL